MKTGTVKPSIHKALASLDLDEIEEALHRLTSIHKALASLDWKDSDYTDGREAD